MLENPGMLQNWKKKSIIWLLANLKKLTNLPFFSNGRLCAIVLIAINNFFFYQLLGTIFFQNWSIFKHYFCYAFMSRTAMKTPQFD